jgi:hypothetical protein
VRGGGWIFQGYCSRFPHVPSSAPLPCKLGLFEHRHETLTRWQASSSPCHEVQGPLCIAPPYERLSRPSLPLEVVGYVSSSQFDLTSAKRNLLSMSMLSFRQIRRHPGVAPRSTRVCAWTCTAAHVCVYMRQGRSPARPCACAVHQVCMDGVPGATPHPDTTPHECGLSLAAGGTA